MSMNSKRKAKFNSTHMNTALFMNRSDLIHSEELERKLRPGEPGTSCSVGFPFCFAHLSTPYSTDYSARRIQLSEVRAETHPETWIIFLTKRCKKMQDPSSDVVPRRDLHGVLGCLGWLQLYRRATPTGKRYAGETRGLRSCVRALEGQGAHAHISAQYMGAHAAYGARTPLSVHRLGLRRRAVEDRRVV